MPSAMENGFPSTRHDAFPAGLRVLVVDDDPTWLKILEKMLKKCSYEVTTCGLARDALNLLRERKDGYDIVISDVNMPDMDGFKLLEYVGLEMDLPVIMMSVDGETSRVMKGVQHGACDYLLKPIRMKELRNIWQHVFRKRIHDLRDIEGIEVMDCPHMTRSGVSDRSDDGFFFYGEDITSGKKRKDVEGIYDKDFVDPPSSTKKARVVWSVDLHQKFVRAVNQIGFDKVGPKKILDLMNVPRLTRENVASHLQKYRLYLSRLQKDNDLKPCFGGLKHSDTTTSQDPPSSFCNPYSINIHQNDNFSNGSFGFATNSVFFPNMKNDRRKGSFQIPKEEPKRVLEAEAPNQHLDSRVLQIGFKAPFPQQLDSAIPAHYSWRGVTEIPFSKQNKEGMEELRHLPLPRSCNVPQAKAVGPQPCRAEGEKTTSTTQATSLRTRTGHLTVQEKGHMENSQDFGSKTPSMENTAAFNPNGDIIQRVGWLQDDAYPINLGFHNIDFSEFDDPSYELPMNLYDTHRYDYEQLTETECSVLGQGLFMA